MSVARLVIVGASLAGLRAAEAARRHGWDGSIVLVGEEPHMPYMRPPLSKQLLTDPAPGPAPQPLPVSIDAEWHLGARAIGLARERRTVVLSDGEWVAYDRLLVASGSRARTWPGPGGELAGLHTLRTVEDAVTLRAALAGHPRVAIIGAGFIGCEVAASARTLGLDVSLFDVVATPMPALGTMLGKRCAAMHRDNGVDLHLGASIAALRGEHGQVSAVELADGTRHPADLVVVALGAAPCTDWLTGSGLMVDGGLRCDATLTADGDPDVLAAGDIAAWPHALAGGNHIRVEHWTNAAEHGALAGRNAVVPAAEREPHEALPSFWSDQYGIRIQALGLPNLAERQHIVEESEDGSRLVAVGERNGRVVSVVAFDGARRMPAYRRHVGGPLDLAALHAAVAADPKAFGTPGRDTGITLDAQSN